MNMQSMRFEKAKEKGNETIACKAAGVQPLLQRQEWRQVQNSAWDVPEEQRSAEAAEQTRWQAFVVEQDAKLEADCAKWRDEEEAERQVRLCKRFGWEANKAELQEERDADEAQLEADSAKWRNEEEVEQEAERRVRLRKRFGREANKAELQEERDADEAQLEADSAKWRDEEEVEQEAERRVRLRKRFGQEANKAELQEERDADEAQLEANCFKWRDEEEAELRARFDAAEQEPDVAKKAVQLAVQNVSDPALNCVEQKAGQHVIAFFLPAARVELFKSLDERAEARLTQTKENSARLALQPVEQKKRTAEEVVVKVSTAEEVVVKVSAVTAASSAQAPAAVVLSMAVALALKDILKYLEQVHQDEVVTTYAASAGMQEVACTIDAVGGPPTAFATTTSPEEIMDSNKAADVAPWITQLKERFKAMDMERDAWWTAQLKQHLTGLDAKGEAQREQTVQLEQKNVEKQAVLSNRDHKESRQIETVADGIDLRSAQREQPAQLERMKEQQAVQSTRDHKLQQE